MDYRFVDHTGDFALEVEAAGPEAAVEATARGLLHLLTDAPESVREEETRTITLEALDGASLLVELGNELLYLFEAEGFLWSRLVLTPGGPSPMEGALEGTLHGEPFDPSRHPIARPFKAVTHHGALLRRRAAGTEARIIVDL